MATILDLPTNKDSRGDLTVIENMLNYTIKRVYYIYNCDDSIRGGHSHKITKQTLISVKGSCRINIHNDQGYSNIKLDNPAKGLYLDVDDYHTMDQFSEDCVLLVLASELYDKNDYVDEDIWNK